MSPRIRLGVVGLGRAAAQMLPSMAAHPEISITAGADPNPNARERFALEFSGATFKTAEDLCSSGKIDAAYVATPHQFHCADVLTLCAYRKHVLVEKPMALSIEDCQAMTEAAQRAGIVLVVGHTHGFDPSIALMRKLIESGEFGALRMITNVAYTNFLYRPRRPEELDTSMGGGIFYNQVPHQIEIARALARTAIHRVRAIAGRWDRARPTEGAMAALVEFDQGVAASLVYSGYDHFDADELHFWIGENGEEKTPQHARARRALTGNDEADEIAQREASGYAGRGSKSSGQRMHHPHLGLLLVSCEGADLRPSADGVLVYDNSGVREIGLRSARAYPNRDAVVDEFVDAISRHVAPLHDGVWGTYTIGAAIALLKSAQEGREILLDYRTNARQVQPDRT